MSILITSLMGFAIPIVQMREGRLFDIFQIMPLSKLTFVSSFVTSRLIIMIGLTVVFVAVAVGFMGVTVDGGITKALMGVGALAVGCVCFISQGMLVASRISTVATATVVCNALYFLQTFLGDLFIPIGGLPVWLKTILTAMPARHMCEALRSAVGASGSASAIAGHVAVMIAWAAAFLILTRFGFVWRRSSGR
jgi:ABC-2 type transport system permease protein